jgi:hypothetical protein
MAGSPQPKFNEAVFCAGCHEQDQEALLPEEELDQERWPNGLPVHSTYTEWNEGPYNQDSTPCQWCHMPANVDKTNAIDIATVENQSITFGFPREPEDIRQHLFRGPLQGEPRLIDTAIHLSLVVEKEATTLSVTASLANIGCGHAVPTGEPMRSLILLIEGEGTCGSLTPTGGMTIPDIGGSWKRGVVGQEIIVSGEELIWPEGAAHTQVGMVIRVVRPSGVYDDYPGIGFFADPQRSPIEKGMEIMTPITTRSIIGRTNERIQLNTPLSLLDGDVIYIGDTLPDTELDDSLSKNLAGHAGYAFARILIDSSGTRHIPHYRATDMASDNRIGPGSNSTTTHLFNVPTGCDSGSIRARVLYRPIPTAQSRIRGWEAKDYLIAESTENWG